MNRWIHARERSLAVAVAAVLLAGATPGGAAAAFPPAGLSVRPAGPPVQRVQAEERPFIPAAPRRKPRPPTPHPSTDGTPPAASTGRPALGRLTAPPPPGFGQPPPVPVPPAMPGPGTAPAMPDLSATAPAAPAPSVPPADAPAVAIPEGTSFRLVFAPQSRELPPDAAPLLDGLAARLNRSETARIQLRAYAAATPETAREARKLSLDRALAVRGHLVDRGVRSTRIDVRALGATTDAADGAGAGAPPDRIDILIVN